MLLRVYWLSCSMFNAFQWNCFNLVVTCNIAFIIFLKCDVTKFRIILPVTQCHTSSTPSAPSKCDIIYGCPLFIRLRIRFPAAVEILLLEEDSHPWCVLGHKVKNNQLPHIHISPISSCN